MKGTRISAAADFPHTAVYAINDAKGNVFTVAFNNWEYSVLWQFLTMLAALAITVLGIFFIDTARIALDFGLPELVGPGVTSAIGILLFWRGAMYPFKFKRAIELDFGRDQLRVLKGKRTKIRRQLTRLANLTVEDHPDAEVARQKRYIRGQRILVDVEKQHSLIGWFGAGGSEQVILLSRAEYPNRHSLFEVRQAIMWAIERASSGPIPHRAADSQKPADETMKPPLD